MDTRRPTGSRYLCGCGRDLSAVQHRPRRGQRRVLPPDRAGLPARARALPPPARGALGALARAGGARRRRGRARAAPAGRRGRGHPRAARRALPRQGAEQGRRLRRHARRRVQSALHRLGGPRARVGRPQPAGREAAEGPLGGALRAAPRGLAHRHRRDRAHRAARTRGRDQPAQLRRARPDRRHPGRAAATTARSPAS